MPSTTKELQKELVMKTTKILSLVLIAVMCMFTLVACGGEDPLEKITVNVKVTADGKSIIDDVVVIEYKGDDGYIPSALDAVIKACTDLEYSYTLWGNDNSLESISGEDIETYAMNDTMWWRCTINGVEPELGTAGENPIKNNDTIVFSYEEIPDFEEENK